MSNSEYKIEFEENQSIESKDITNELPTKINLNNKFCSILHGQLFSEKECDAITGQLLDELWLPGKVEGNNIKNNMRKVEVQPVPMNKEGWPLMQVIKFAKQANDVNYKFNCYGFLEEDTPSIMRYKKGGHYDWHLDIGNSVSHRKLSFTIQLTDSKEYEGGDLEFLGTKVNTEAFRKKGTCIIYPSFLTHRVTKVTKGTRDAIVGWVHGVTFK